MKINTVNTTTPFYGTVIYNDRAKLASQIEDYSFIYEIYHSTNLSFNASQAHAFVCAFNKLKDDIETNTPDSFVCSIDSYNDKTNNFGFGVLISCFDSEKKDEASFDFSLNGRDLKYKGAASCCKWIRTVFEKYTKRIMGYANFEGDRQAAAELNYADYKSLKDNN